MFVLLVVAARTERPPLRTTASQVFNAHASVDDRRTFRVTLTRWRRSFITINLLRESVFGIWLTN